MVSEADTSQTSKLRSSFFLSRIFSCILIGLDYLIDFTLFTQFEAERRVYVVSSVQNFIHGQSQLHTNQKSAHLVGTT